MVFRLLTKFVQPLPQSVFLSTPEGAPYLLAIILGPPPHLLATVTLSLRVYLFWIFYINGIIK